MTQDDMIYTIILILSLVTGPLVQKCGKYRPWFAAVVGFLMFFCFAGQAVWHSLLTSSVFTLAFILFPARFLHYVAVVWCFGYLGFFRTCHYFGFSQVTPVANIVQLLLTLRLIGASFEISDSWRINNQLQHSDLHPQDKSKLELLKKYKCIEPSPMMIMLYAYCYIGLFTGPYYNLKTFEDFCNRDPETVITAEEPLLQHLQEAPPFGVAYLILSHFYTVDYVRTAEFYDRHFLYRFFYMMVIFFTFRMRIYFAWKMSECVCISARLGAYPKLSEPEKGEGPTNLHALDLYMEQQAANDVKLNSVINQPNHLHRHQTSDPVNSVIHSTLKNKPNFEMKSETNVVYNYNTISNLSIWGCEFAPTVRESMKSWNCSVQFWLANYFYRRCKASRNIRTLWTMMVSAYWHGLHAGYYLSFLVIPLALVGETSLKNLMNLCANSLPTGSVSFISWLLKMRVFEYCCMGFLLLDWETTIAYWSSIYFCIHIVLIGLIIFDYFLRLILPAKAFKIVSSLDSSTVSSLSSDMFVVNNDTVGDRSSTLHSHHRPNYKSKM
ncbi:unnamed protein product [Schistosoma curassoni]|nr:unnamed protein product [Schistosoma curassoni]